MLFSLFFLIPVGAAAQEVNIAAEVNKSVATLTDQIVLSVSVSADLSDVPEPRMPSMPNFSVYSSGRSQNISIVNGRMSSSVVYTYILTPRFVGKATIAPISVTVGGRTVQTAPIDIQIVRPNQASGTAPPQGQSGAPFGRIRPNMPQGESGAPDVFITAALNKTKAFVNEQTILTVRFYTSVPLLGNPQYQSPATQGFLTEDLPPERHGQAQAHGRIYHYSEIRTALFPAQAGRLTIGPATVQCQLQSDVGMDPFASDFFQRFFAQGMLAGQTRTLKTDALNLSVEPLPTQNKPDSFNGAVGEFRITANADKRKTQVGEAINLSVEIEGTGNIKALVAPPFPELSSFRVYETLTGLNLRKEQDTVRGSKTFKTVLVPRASGMLTIPSIRFSYFNPATRQYVQAHTDSISIQAAPQAATSPGVSYVGSSGGSPELTTVTEDIRYIKETAKVPVMTRAISRIAGLGWIHFIPLILFLSTGSLQLYREQIQKDPVRARSRSALANARRHIQEAERHIATAPLTVANHLANALTGFLADKLNCAAYGLTLREVSQRIASRFPKMNGRHAERIKTAWENLDQFRFAGKNAANAADAAALISEIGQLLQELDREMKP